MMGISVMVASLISFSLLTLLLISFVSTRIRRAPDFPVRDKITVLNYQIDGKRFTVAPYPRNPLESFIILLYASLWILFKIDIIRYNSPSKNKLIFGTSLGLSAVLILGSCVSSAYALMYHYKRIQMAQAKHAQHLQLASTQTNQGAAAPPPPPTPSKGTHHAPSVSPETRKQVASTATNNTNNTTSDVQSTDNKIASNGQPTADSKASSSSENYPPTAPRAPTEHHTTVAERKNVGERVAGVIHQITKPLHKIVEVDGRRVLDTDNVDKIASVVRDAVRKGASDIRILHIGQ